MSIVHLVLGLVVVGLFVFVVLYATYLFVCRIRRREAPVKAFFIWLRELFDAASGLG